MWWYSWTKKAAPTPPEVSQADYKMQGMQPPTSDSKFPFVLLKNKIKKKNQTKIAQSSSKIVRHFCGQSDPQQGMLKPLDNTAHWIRQEKI